jgi:UDP-N-acetyl-2-amino-2-deoxyglucuronate dehydrogenase
MNFSLIGAAGYVAPRHMKAIKESGHSLVSVFDPHDTLGVMDQYFPEAICFSDFTQYDRFHTPGSLDFVSICSPNYLHYSHIKWALEKGAKVICEKPLVIEPNEIEALKLLEKTPGTISTILQLRLLPEIIELKNYIDASGIEDFQVEVDYVSARGSWYFNSWKAKEQMSGGLVTNIGIHLFDLLLWIFGPVEGISVTEYNLKTARGTLKLRKARVNWFLSIDPKNLTDPDQKSFRQLKVGDSIIRLDQGMEHLHNQCYTAILGGRGPGIDDAAPSILLCNQIRQLAT